MKSKPQIIRLDITNPRANAGQIVHIVGGDACSRLVEAIIYDNGEARSELKNVPAQLYIEPLAGTRPIFIDIVIVDGISTFTIPQSAGATAGRMNAAVRIVSNDATEIISSMPFIIECMEPVYSESAVLGTDEADTLKAMVNTANAAVGTATAAAQTATDAASEAATSAENSLGFADSARNSADSAAQFAESAADCVEAAAEAAKTAAEEVLADKVDKSQVVSSLSSNDQIPNGAAAVALCSEMIMREGVSSEVEQGLGDEQKALARSNIGAVSTDELAGAINASGQTKVSVTESQSFTDAQKALARSNISAVSQDELSDGLDGKVDKSLVVSELTGPKQIPNGDAVYTLCNNLISLNGVSSAVEQSLSDSQKSTARNNIGAASAEDVSILQLAVEHLSEISWKDIQLIVRVGKGPLYFPVGYEFTTLDSDTGADIIWVVRGHDHHTPANSQLTHSMTIEMKHVYSNASDSYKNLQFDASEALYYAEDGLAAGTYNFTLLAGYDTDYGGGKTLSFTLATPVPAGGVIMFPWVYLKQSTDMKISTYTSNASTSAIESVSVTEGNEGTSLGTADGTTENMNHTRRIRFGSNNYAQSAVRQWLNSSAAAGGVWSPTNKFDRTPTWAATYNGFMHGLPSDFLEVVQPAVIPCYTNPVFEVNSFDGTEFTANQVYTLTDKFFLLSRPEIFGTWDSTAYKDGEQLEYYEGLTDTERIKYDAAGSARTCWLRSPIAVNTVEMNYERYLSSSGTLSRDHANNSTHGVAPACIIA